MQILELTVFLSLLLAGLFFLSFIHQGRTNKFNNAEQKALLPLEKETLKTKSKK